MYTHIHTGSRQYVADRRSRSRGAPLVLAPSMARPTLEMPGSAAAGAPSAAPSTPIVVTDSLDEVYG